MMNIEMNSQRHSSAVMALLLLVVAVLACSTGDETAKANKLVNEGNAALDEGKKSLQEANEKKEKMLAGISAIKSDADLEKTRSIAKECVAAYDKAVAKYKEAAQKSDEASKLKLNDKFKEYLALKAKEYNKRAELFEAEKGVPQAMIDSANKESFISTSNATKEKVDKLAKEADDLAAQADKIEKDNPDIIKS